MLLFILAIILIFLFLLYYFDILPTKTVVKKTLPAFNFIYREYIGSYYDVGTHFQEITSALRVAGIEPKLVRLAGCYFDSPNDSPNKKQLRFALGVHCYDQEVDFVWEELHDFGFKRIALPAVSALFTLFTYRNMLSYFLIPFFWRRISSKRDELQIDSKWPLTGVEIYDQHGSKQIMINMVYGEEARRYRFMGS